MNAVFTASIIQRQNYNVAPMLPPRWIVNSSHKYTLNVVLTTLLHCWNHNVIFATSLQRRQIYNVLTIYYVCCNGNVNTTLQPRRQFHNVFWMPILRRYTYVALALRGTSNVNQRRIQKPAKRLRQISFEICLPKSPRLLLCLLY